MQLPTCSWMERSWHHSKGELRDKRVEGKKDGNKVGKAGGGGRRGQNGSDEA